MEASMTPNYIHLKDIDKARDELWKQHQGTSSVRATLFNLIIYAKNNDRQEYLEKMAQSVIKKFPCRIIRITENQANNEHYLRTYVSDLRPDDKSPSLYCDMINFEVAGNFIERIPFVVLPNLLPDHPIYLLWGEDPSKQETIASTLIDYATRTIFDSESSESMTDFAKTLLNLHDKVSCDIGDLNWARLSPWRALFVHTFNDHEKLKTLKEAKDIRILYNMKSTKQFCHNKIQATYFQAWIASRLQWKFDTSFGTKEELCFKYHSTHGAVTVTISPSKQDDVPPGRILKLEVHSYSNDFILFEKNKQNPQQITIRHCTPSLCEMPAFFLFDKESSGKSMIHEIYSQGTRDSFLHVLKLITQFNQGSICS